MSKKYGGYQLTMLACLLGFAILGVLVGNGNIAGFDQTITQAVQWEQTRFLDHAAKWLAVAAAPKWIIFLSVGAAIAACALAFAVKREKMSAAAEALVLLAGVTVLSGAANQLLKNIFQRPRPLPEIHSYSFPSGHSMLGFAFCMTAAYLLSRSTRTPLARALALLFGIVGTLLIGLSRIYLNMHYPSDVLAGFFLSAFILLLAIRVYEKMLAKTTRSSANS